MGYILHVLGLRLKHNFYDIILIICKVTMTKKK